MISVMHRLRAGFGVLLHLHLERGGVLGFGWGVSFVYIRTLWAEEVHILEYIARELFCIF